MLRSWASPSGSFIPSNDEDEADHMTRRVEARQIISRSIDELISKNGITQQQLARASGVDPGTISRILRQTGRGCASADTILMIADAFGVDPGKLLGGSGRDDREDAAECCRLRAELEIIRGMAINLERRASAATQKKQ